MTKHTLYIKKSNDTVVLIVALYVDDMLTTSPDKVYLEDFKTQMLSVFEMTDLGLMSYFLGMEILQLPIQIILHQTKYKGDILKKFRMESRKDVNIPLLTGCMLSNDDGSIKANGMLYKNIIRSLLYMSATRPDLMFATSLFSKFMQSPLIEHFTTTKRLLRYVKGTVNYGLVYVKDESSDLLGYCDSD